MSAASIEESGGDGSTSSSGMSEDAAPQARGSPLKRKTPSPTKKKTTGPAIGTFRASMRTKTMINMAKTQDVVKKDNTAK